jgi:hypothetical protein
MSTLAVVVHDCAVAAIRSTVAAIDSFFADYSRRISGLRSRLSLSKTVVDRLPLTAATGSLKLAVRQVDAALEMAASLVTNIGKTRRAALLLVPDTLGSLVDRLGYTAPSTQTICSKVEAILSPQIVNFVNELNATRITVDARLQGVAQALQDIEKALASLQVS